MRPTDTRDYVTAHLEHEASRQHITSHDQRAELRKTVELPVQNFDHSGNNAEPARAETLA